MFATCDLSGVVRGKSFPASELARHETIGVAWVPANQALDAFSVIPADNPFGPLGDLRLLADPATRVRVEGLEGASPLHFYLGDIVETDGAPWDCCTRGFAKRALADLQAEAGLQLQCAFEQEFALLGLEGPPKPAFSLAGLRAADPFAVGLLAALRQAGVAVEMLLPEYGALQYEITCAPTLGVAAADRAIAIREVAREVARVQGLRATFAPKLAPAGVGNGVHLHFSLRDRADRPVTAGRDEPLSEVAGRFVAGVLAHLPALCALVAPSVVSYLRLQPHHWSSAYTCFGVRNREATLRLCPVVEFPGMAAAAQANVEFRAPDAAASPYMVLGAMARAGLDGIRRRLPAPPAVNADPDTLAAAERERLGVRRLPASLSEALVALEADNEARSWFSPRFLDCYLAIKRSEIAACAGLTDETACRKYAEVY